MNVRACVGSIKMNISCNKLCLFYYDEAVRTRFHRNRLVLWHSHTPTYTLIHCMKYTATHKINLIDLYYIVEVCGGRKRGRWGLQWAQLLTSVPSAYNM